MESSPQENEGKDTFNFCTMKYIHNHYPPKKEAEPEPRPKYKQNPFFGGGGVYITGERSPNVFLFFLSFPSQKNCKKSDIATFTPKSTTADSFLVF